ncbi:MAG TPA: 3-oxoadipate enol-lactonase [Acidimicrobiales bacterium]|nr:3-oxoadipate enol-lactonase [Acidimicrobiales bacterium]
MPEVDLGGWPVSYELAGPKRAPLLVLVGSLGTASTVWDHQMPALSAWFRVLRVEHPGHGGAGAPRGPYTIEALGGVLVRLLDALGAGRVCFAGLSLGGLIGMWLASKHPQRVERLALCCSAPRFEPPETWLRRAGRTRAEGTQWLVDASLGKWFTPQYLGEHPDVASQYSSALSRVDREGYASCCEALAAADLWPALARIETPTLVLGGASDPVVPPELASATMKAIPGATLCVLSPGAHMVNVERADAFNQALLQHLTGGPQARGLAVRQAVLGAAHVESALAGASELTAPFQDLLTRWPWGEVWARPGLDRQTRRLITIAMLVALGHSKELELHMRQALRDGLSTSVLREVLLQTAVYAGVPAANSAFAIAERALAQITEDPDDP